MKFNLVIILSISQLNYIFLTPKKNLKKNYDMM